MKFYVHFLFLICWTFIGYEPAKQESEVIRCYPVMEEVTLQAYIREASGPAFASMHPAPNKFRYDQQAGNMIQFPVADGLPAKGYYIPANKKSNRWLIVVQEWWGLNDQIKAEADKYHRELPNMHVLAVDMYDGKVAATPDSAIKLTRGADVKRMRSIIEGAIAHAGSDASIYSVGWCFGGMWSLQTAILAGKQAKGAIMFYGRPETDMEKLRSIECDVIGFFGNLDRSPSPSMVVEFEKNMLAAGKKLITYKYEAGHGFANPSNPNHNAEAAADTYEKSIAFLQAH